MAKEIGAVGEEYKGTPRHQNVSYDDLGHHSNIYVNKSIGDYEMISGSYKFGKLNIEMVL